MKYSKLLDRITTWVMWTSWILLLIWSIAKMLGFINTPVWLENVPLLLGTIGVLGFLGKVSGFLLKAGRYMERFDIMERDLQEVKQDVRKNTINIAKITTKLDF